MSVQPDPQQQETETRERIAKLLFAGFGHGYHSWDGLPAQRRGHWLNTADEILAAASLPTGGGGDANPVCAGCGHRLGAHPPDDDLTFVCTESGCGCVEFRFVKPSGGKPESVCLSCGEVGDGPGPAHACGGTSNAGEVAPLRECIEAFERLPSIEAELDEISAHAEAQARVIDEVRGVLVRRGVECEPVLAATVERLIVERDKACAAASPSGETGDTNGLTAADWKRIALAAIAKNRDRLAAAPPAGETGDGREPREWTLRGGYDGAHHAEFVAEESGDVQLRPFEEVRVREIPSEEARA